MCLHYTLRPSAVLVLFACVLICFVALFLILVNNNVAGCLRMGHAHNIDDLVKPALLKANYLS